MLEKSDSIEKRNRTLNVLIGKKIVDAYVFNMSYYNFYSGKDIQGNDMSKYNPYMGQDEVKIILDDGTIIHTYDGEAYASETGMWINGECVDDLMEEE